jgi:glycosyltransferase involved in cell wall biosynthesis
MRSPFFSVVLPTYNRAGFITSAVQSVLAQTYGDWELIIIDDGSTDNTKEIVAKFTDTRIRYIWQQNAERSAARNKGINLSNGEFICFLDSDDTWKPCHLQTHFNKIKECNYEAALYFTGMVWNFSDRKKEVIFPAPDKNNQVEYVITNQIGTPTVCIHHTILKTEQFNTTLRINEDVELFARIVARHKLIQIPTATIDVIVHDTNTMALEKNYILPQIHAMEVIFNHPLLKNRISESFKRDRFLNLHHQLINHYLATGEFGKMNREIIRFLFLYPDHFQNKSKLVLLLYHLPGGGLLQKVVNQLKGK